MFCARKCFCNLVLLAAVGASLTACPPQYNDAPVELMVSPTQLDFGPDATTRQISVTKNSTSRAMNPLSVTSLDPWILPQSCTNGGSGCVSIGPLDAIRVTIRVDRSRMSLGSNNGALMLHSAGAVSKTVQIVADALLVPDFTASKRSPQPGELVQFTDLTQSADGPVVSREWDFGDGTKSTASSPSHIFSEERAYRVSLKVTTANRTETAVKEDFIMVGGQGPIADFTATPQTVFQGETVKFTDRSSSGVGQIKSWAWTFGDGGTSTSASPYYTYQAAGKYSVTLTVSNEYGSDSETKQSYIFVQSKVPPVASFINGPPYVNQYIQFTDTSLPGSQPITERRWNFGDPSGYLNISTQPNPKYMYRSPGTYPVTLTVKTEHGTSTVARDIQVVYAPLTASFDVSRERALVNDNITFTDTSLFGSLPITSWTWEFGDGTTSTAQKPIHNYGLPGTYTVKLTVGTAAGSSTVTREGLINVFERRALDDFMRRTDYSYSYELKRTVENYGVTGYVLLMTSQQWRSAEEVDKPFWKHWVTLLVPPNVTNNTALLMVSGGNNTSAQLGDPAPSTIDPVMSEVAKETGSVVVMLNQVPSERLVFLDDFDPRYMVNGRSEDEIISYTYHKYFETFAENDGTGLPPDPDETWPLLLAMAKSAVKAMDATQDFMKKRPSPVIVEDFVVTGASKRGWTTWLTGAYDHRVRAIAPIVIDVLNMDVQMEHHRSSYGFYSEAIIDYVDLFIFEHFNQADGQALLEIVDPFEYRERLIMPKLIINSTGDEFFLPDSAQFYFHELLGQRHITYSPNTNHGMGGYQNVINRLVPWYKGVVEERALPVISWTAENTRIDARTQVAPQQVLVWSATSPTRDFRFNTELQPNPPTWSSRTLEPSGLNRYIAEPTRSATAWTAFFIEFKFDSGMNVGGAPAPYTVCTECRVAPPTSPMAPRADFYSNKQRAQVNEEIEFTDQTAQGTSNISMWEWDFGDGETSSLRDPVHLYKDPGTYTVSLTVRSLAGEDTRTRESYITILAPTGKQKIPNVVGLAEADARIAITRAGFVAGTSTSQVSETVPEGFVISQSPAAGEEWAVKTVVTLVVSSGSSTEEYVVPNVLGMTQAQAQAAIEAAHFRVGLITREASPIYPEGQVMAQDPLGGQMKPENTQINLVVSKGAVSSHVIVPNVVGMTEANAKAAIETAKLVVGDPIEYLASGTVPEGSVISQSPAAGAELLLGDAVSLVVSLGAMLTELDTFINSRPVEVEYEVADIVPRYSTTAYVLDLKSQDWLTSAEVDRPEWRHWLSVIVPHQVKSSTALMLVSGGYYNDPMPNWRIPAKLMQSLEDIAEATKSVVALLPQVPSQRLKFTDESDPRYMADGRTEDEIIAYSYDKYMDTQDPRWPALFPMVMSAVRAMDAIQDFYDTSFVEDFVVTGASKRGWTTWLTGAVDNRVRAIVPMVIDVLNMDEQMRHHYNAYNGLPESMHVFGGYSDSVEDYVDMDIFDRFDTPEGEALLRLVDPYEYRSRLYMPKLILNATGDQFFLPDSSQFYLNELPGETALRYLPNTEHGLENDDQSTLSAANSIGTFFQAQLMGGKMPRYPWTYEGSRTIRVKPLTAALSAKVWYASNPYERDFRVENVGRIWQSQTLVKDNLGDYTATVPMPETGWTAFLVELTYTSPILGVPYVFTTPVRVIPDLLVPGLEYPLPLYRNDLLPHMDFEPSTVHFPVGVDTVEVSLVNSRDEADRGLRWTLDPNSVPDWLTVSTYSGEIPGGWLEEDHSFPLFLDVDRGMMPSRTGNYEATLLFSTNGFQGTLELPVTMEPGTPGLSCTGINFGTQGRANTIRVLNTGDAEATYYVNPVNLPRWIYIERENMSGTVAGGRTALIPVRCDRTVEWAETWYQHDLPIQVSPTLACSARIEMQSVAPVLTYSSPTSSNPTTLDYGASLTQHTFVFRSEPLCDMLYEITGGAPGITLGEVNADDDGVLYTSNGGPGWEEARHIAWETDRSPHGAQFKTLTFTLDRTGMEAGTGEATYTIAWGSREGINKSLDIKLLWTVTYPPDEKK